MPVTSNRFYNDPSLGAAFSNLANIFAPPSGSDLAGYAGAKAKQEEAARLAELFNYAKDPNYDQGLADRMGVLGGLYAPTQSYHAVNLGDATTRRGQDVTASTSRANNAADNIRALQERELMEAAAMERLGITDATDRRGQNITAHTSMFNNRADNARALDVARMANTTDITQSLLAPVGQGATRHIPPSIADMFDLPATQAGNIAAAPGETIVTPDNGTIMGVPKPLSEAEQKAVERQGLIASGQLTDQMLVDTIVGAETPVQVVGPDGKTPQFSTPGAAVRTGAQPFVNRGSEAKPVNYQTPDGKRGTASTDNTGRLVDTQTGQPLPEGSVTFGTNIQGNEAETGLSTKTNQTKSVQIRGTVTNMNGLVNELETLVAQNPAATGLAGNVLSFTQDAKQVVAEFGQKFGGDPNMPITPQQASEMLNALLPETGNYNPVYRKAAALTFELAYANAKLNNPGGEVSRFALERELEQLGQGLVGNDKALLAVIEVSKGRMKRALDEADVLSGASQGVTADQIGQPVQSQPGPVEKWDIIDGKLQRVQ